jgi:hypothetical protein
VGPNPLIAPYMVSGKLLPLDKTTIYLPKELHVALKRTSRRTGKPQVQLIREALVAYLDDQTRPRPATTGMISLATVSSDNLEEWLDENWTPD